MLPEEVTVQNIKTRFLENGALVIQWPEPDGALMGGMQLRLSLSKNTVGPDGCIDENFLWINSPAQIGTVVVTADIWNAFVQRVLADDPTVTEIEGRFQYRTQTNTTEDLSYMNRGFSGPFTIPIQ